jgi:glycerol kinase
VTGRRFVLALDQGTTGSTALVIDPDGAVRARGYAELPQHYPQPGWVEHDPAQIWGTTVQALGQAVASAGISPAQIAAVGITNQRETDLWERASGSVDAIVWQCRRTAADCDRLRAEGWADPIRAKTGLVVDAYFSGTKLAGYWSTSGLPDRAERGRPCSGRQQRDLAPPGGGCTSPMSNTSRVLFNIHPGLGWELLAELHPRAILPQVRPSLSLWQADPAAGAAYDGGAAGISRQRCSGRRATPGRANPTARAASCCSTPGTLRSPRRTGS